MSRHTYVRRMNEDDYEDDDDYDASYGSSYGSDYGLSKSLEQQYMFKRDMGGHAPQFSTYMDNLGEGESEFEMDLGLGPADADAGAGAGAAAMKLDSGEKKSLVRMTSTFDTSSLSQDEMARLNSCLDHILDIVGETVPEYTVKETIVRCKYDAEKALNDLLNSSTSSSSKLMSDPPELKVTSSQTKVTAPVVKAPLLKVKQSGFEPASARANFRSLRTH